MTDSRAAGAGPGRGDDGGFAYLLVQLGFHVAGKFRELIEPLGLEPRHVGMLMRLAANEGKSQQAIGELIGLNPTRMVFLVDELEQRGLIERRRNPADRRSYALYLTGQGRAKLHEAYQAGAEHQELIGASLTDAQRGQLTALLRKVADEQGVGQTGLLGPLPWPGGRS